MAKVNLPGPHGVLAERDGRTSRAFYDWFRRIQDQIDAGELSTDDAVALIAEMATKLGSPDGTVENIPENVIRAGTGIAVYPNGDLRQNDVFIALDPNTEPVPPLPLGAYLTLGEALEGEQGFRGPPGRDGRDGAPAPLLMPDEPMVEFAIPGPQGPAGPAGRDGVMALLFDFDQGEPNAFAPPVNLAYAYGNLPVGNLNSGANASAATFWRGDGTWSNVLTADFTVDTDSLFVDSTNHRVGVGTTSPVQKLEISDSTNIRQVIRNSSETTGYSCSFDFTTGTGALSSSNIVARLVAAITQADPSTLKSSLSVVVNVGDSATTVATWTADKNLGLNTTAQFGGGVGVIGVANATTTPTSNPTGGAVWYVEGGASKARGSSGTTTTFAAAEPHCPVCGSDFVHEWDNPERYGYLAVCMNCHVDGINSHTRIRGAWSDT